MHLAPEVFWAMSIEEFTLANKAWQEQEEQRIEGEWERMRVAAAILIQPHIKKKITADKLLPLPWDRKKIPHQAAPHQSKAESDRRAEELMKRQGHSRPKK